MQPHPDLQLVRAALRGSESAWHELVERATPVIEAALRPRILDVEDRRDAHVAVLAELHDSALRRYEGRASFTTWVFVLARSRAVDHMRRRRGRTWSPPGYDRLDPVAQLAFRLYFVEGLGFSELCDRLGTAGGPVDAEEAAAVLERIESTLDRRVLRRVTYELHAESVGAASGRLLEYVDDLHDEMRRRGHALSPEQQYVEREARAMQRRLRDHVAALDPAERRVLTLRFEDGLKGREIAEVMGLGSTRLAFSLLDRALRALKRRLIDAGGPFDELALAQRRLDPDRGAP